MFVVDKNHKFRLVDMIVVIGNNNMEQECAKVVRQQCQDLEFEC